MRKQVFPSRKQQQLAAVLSLAIMGGVAAPALAIPLPLGHKPADPNSPLTPQLQSALNRAGSSMRSGHYDRAAAVCQSALDQATDVSQCLAIAQYTERVGMQMAETRRNCVNKAFSLAQTREDMLLVALAARKYQFFEVTRNCVQSLIGNARTVKDLYDLATKAQEVALNDIAHMAMEKAYTGIKAQQEAFAFAEQCKALGMDDLLHKVVKELIDDEDDVLQLCDLLEKLKEYNLRDLNRYGLRKAMDNCKTVEEMQGVFEVARRLNEPDVANRANYFVRKGKIIQQIKHDRAEYEAKLRAWREGIDIDAARAQDPTLTPDTTAVKKKGDGMGTGF